MRERSAFEHFVVPSHGAGPAHITYQPGLDGLRGFAVCAVMLFHLGYGFIGGGFLSVSMFFTLSGVLIGTLMLSEITSTGGFSPRRFWTRRARRLLPASLMTLFVLAVARLLTDKLADTSGADIAAAALNVANWHFAADGTSYADLFAGPSAVLHYWSLAIEEQFYVIVAVFAVLVASRAARPVRTMGLTACVVAVGSFALPPVAGWLGHPLAIDRVYYGTDTRAGELMVGVAIAAFVVAEHRRRRILAAARIVACVAVVGLAGTLVLWHVASPGTPGLRSGLLPLTALCSSTVILGALMPTGPVAALAGLGVLRWLGRISYGIYLVHWPVIVVANQISHDRSLWRAAAIVAVTIALAQLSSTLVEVPVRRSHIPLRRLGPVALAAVMMIVATASFTGRRTASAELLADLADTDPSGVAAASHPTDHGSPRLAFFGDSVAFSLLLALDSSPVPQRFVRAPSDVRIGCGIALSPDPPPDDPGACDHPAARYALKAIAGDVEVAVMMSCQWELVTQQLPGGDHPRTIGDPVFDRAVHARFLDVVERLSAAGVSRILWLTCPYMSQRVGTAGLGVDLLDSRRPERMDRLNAIIREIAAERSDVDVLAFSDWVNERVDDAALRPDGSHFEYRTNTMAADELITLIDAALAGDV